MDNLTRDMQLDVGVVSETGLFMNDVWVFLIFLCGYPHLRSEVSLRGKSWSHYLTFLKVFKPAKIDPPIQVEYFRSGGAYIFILTSFSANFLTSLRRRSPKPTRSTSIQLQR